MTVPELKPYGLETMRREEIDTFLDSQSVGVLGLIDGPVPYLLPLSYGYDGESLYFTYLLGDESRKERLTDHSERASFLVYSAETRFNWRSVLLEGEFRKIPPHRWGDLGEVLEGAWRPELFQIASPSRNVKIYALDVDEVTGIKHTGLAAEMESRDQ
ncbi:pyridoxamine 5'-phosphate oxidase family protein [Halapricum salinum]|uniref:Pyridoxamine 5'-phosphate oxidase family protein n=1 Tax=Halapricum salinum TaxID=1457250 RepID=A0A4D6HAS4_9EURY|nr:pyridoxamine 5'-phosphate oxidase family protein [Halapricum salinum]QCC50745.1 pyridoxamine 5'-phosphate oxidase family protein [Halapricum salinum]